MTGLVSLVGAGPGDPDLLTLKAARRLTEADLVLYDALIDRSVLALATQAHCFFVGKRAGRHSISQEEINRLLVRTGRAGRRVVRLKAGDPFIFGRGGEEALALARARVPFEIVPGLSTALSAPALSGIPLTHRGLASSFLVVSGHAEKAYGPILDAVAPQSLTFVVLMGLAQRGNIAARLVQRGWRVSTPVAISFAAAQANARVWLGTLGDLAQAPLQDDSPATITIGEVAALAHELLPIEQPLAAYAAMRKS